MYLGKKTIASSKRKEKEGDAPSKKGKIQTKKE